MKFVLGLVLCVALVNGETYSECSGKPSRTYVGSKKNNCRSFIYCNGNESFEDTCPVGLAFNPTDLTCDDIQNVQCNNDDTDKNEVSTTKIPMISSKIPISTGAHKLHPTPPGKLLVTTNSPKGTPNRPVPTRKTPPGGAIRTNSPTKLTSLILSTTRTYTPKQPPMSTKKVPSSTRSPVKSSSPMLSSGPSMRLPTPPGAKYIPDNVDTPIVTAIPNEIIGSTRMPLSTTKSSKSTTTAQTVITNSPIVANKKDPSAKELCMKQSVGNFAYPDDCRFYYRCSKGVLSKLQCPTGFGWDANYKICSLKNCVNKSA